jgi:hypothetical protein
MYPTIHTSLNPLHSSYPALSTGAPSSGPGSNVATAPAAAAAASSPRPTANGPPTPPQPAFPTLQVAIDPRFQIAPPVSSQSEAFSLAKQVEICHFVLGTTAKNHALLFLLHLQVRAPPQPPGEGGPAAGSAAPPPPPGQLAPSSREPVDLDLERRLLQELAPGPASSSSADGPSTGSLLQARPAAWGFPGKTSSE